MKPVYYVVQNSTVYFRCQFTGTGSGRFIFLLLVHKNVLLFPKRAYQSVASDCQSWKGSISKRSAWGCCFSYDHIWKMGCESPCVSSSSRGIRCILHVLLFLEMKEIGLSHLMRIGRLCPCLLHFIVLPDQRKKTWKTFQAGMLLTDNAFALW